MSLYLIDPYQMLFQDPYAEKKRSNFKGISYTTHDFIGHLKMLCIYHWAVVMSLDWTLQLKLGVEKHTSVLVRIKGAIAESGMGMYRIHDHLFSGQSVALAFKFIINVLLVPPFSISRKN